ncbi:MAG: hypothetical protein KDD70_07875 [Bdellovibrionales bacterium]|nr:hypothetical protein [Bdellovibrionales bacterium]
MKEQNCFVFLAATANQALIFAKLKEQLDKCGIESRFLTLENIYKQTAHLAFQKAGIPYEPIPLNNPPDDWCALDRPERNPYLQEVTSWAWRYFSAPAIHTLIVGNDVGDIEQICIRSAERFGIRTVRIQDGIQGLRRDFPVKVDDEFQAPTLFSPIPMEGGCEIYCVWSDYMKLMFEERGLAGDVKVTGSVRHDEFADIPPYKERRHKEKFVIGVAGQPFASYGDMWPAQEVSLYQHIIQMCLSRHDIEVIFRPHPESRMFDSYTLAFQNQCDRVSIEMGAPLSEFLRNIDALVTVDSSVAGEAAALGIPAQRLLHLRTRTSGEVLRVHEQRFMEYLHGTDFPFIGESALLPDNSNVSAFRPRDFANTYVGTFDGKAVARTINVLIEAEIPRNEASDSGVTILIETIGQDPMAAINTSLKNIRPSDQVLVIDRTPESAVENFFSKRIVDPRLRILRAPLLPLIEALDVGLSHLTTPFILRLTPGTHLLPGALDMFRDQFLAEPNVSFVSSCFFGRNECAASEGFVKVPDSLNYEDLSRFGSYAMTSYCYLTSLQTIRSCDGFLDETHPDLNLLMRLTQKTHQGAKIIQAPLFISPAFFPETRWNSFSDNLPLYEIRWPLSSQEVLSGSQNDSAPQREEIETAILNLFASREFHTALEVISTLKRSDQQRPRILYLKALAEAKTHNFVASKETLEETLSLDSDFKDARQLLSYLEERL